MDVMADQCGTAREMPRYKCHKEVWALKIKDIRPEYRGVEEIVGAIITPEEDGFGDFAVTREYLLKHKPKVGGYYVVYADGYKSFSPPQAFQEGYTRV